PRAARSPRCRSSSSARCIRMLAASSGPPAPTWLPRSCASGFYRGGPLRQSRGEQVVSLRRRQTGERHALSEPTLAWQRRVDGAYRAEEVLARDEAIHERLVAGVAELHDEVVDGRGESRILGLDGLRRQCGWPCLAVDTVMVAIRTHGG